MEFCRARAGKIILWKWQESFLLKTHPGLTVLPWNNFFFYLNKLFRKFAMQIRRTSSQLKLFFCQTDTWHAKNRNFHKIIWASKLLFKYTIILLLHKTLNLSEITFIIRLIITHNVILTLKFPSELHNLNIYDQS